MKRRLLIISGAINYGSSCRIVEPVGLLAEKNGYEVLVAHSSKNENSIQLCHSLLHLNMKSENTLWGAMLFDLHGLLSDKATKELIVKIKKLS